MFSFSLGLFLHYNRDVVSDVFERGDLCVCGGDVVLVGVCGVSGEKGDATRDLAPCGTDMGGSSSLFSVYIEYTRYDGGSVANK
jgi:hypothetical protein